MYFERRDVVSRDPKFDIFRSEVEKVFNRIETLDAEDPKRFRAIQREVTALMNLFLQLLRDFGFSDSDFADRDGIFREGAFPGKDCSRLGPFGDFMQRIMREKKSMVWDKFERAMESFRSHPESWEESVQNPKSLLRGISIFSALAQFFPDTQEEVTVDFLERVLASSDRGGYSDVFSVEDVCSSFLRGHFDLDVNASAARFFLRREGLPEESVYEDLQANFYFTGRKSLWEKFSAGALEGKKQELRQKKKSCIATNIERIVSFGETASGDDIEYGRKALQYLVVECGISNMGRYSAELLWKQYENRENIETPYGVMIVAKADHNGSSFNREELFSGFSESSRQLGTLIRIIECGSGRDCLKKLLKFRNKYEKTAGRIAFLVLRAHGNETGVLLGIHGGAKEMVEKSVVDGRGMTKFLGKEGILDPDAPVALLSCISGKKEGVADHVAKKRPKTGRISASPGIRSTKHIFLVRNEETGALDFDIEFLRKGKYMERSVTYSGESE